MTDKTISGSCLCGTVTYRYTGPSKVFQYCHCSRCRKFTGAAFGANIIVDPAQFEWLGGEENTGHYVLPEAKHFATCFCKTCGSSLPWLAQSGKAVIIPSGTLDDDPYEQPRHNVHYASHVPWLTPVDELAKYDALPVK